MPGMNGTGPLGQGPMTGGGRGVCGRGQGLRPEFGQGYGRGFGQGFGRGLRRGAGRFARRGLGAMPMDYGPADDDRQTMEQRLQALEDEARLLRERLGATK